MNQEDVAKHLGTSRSTVAQMELGKRAVSSLELDRLAYLFGRDIREFVADAFREDDTLAALFRAEPTVAEHPEVVEKIRECIAIGRELTHVERLLGIDREQNGEYEPGLWIAPRMSRASASTIRSWASSSWRTASTTSGGGGSPSRTSTRTC